MSHANPADSTPKTETKPPVPGNLWNDFLRRNLLLASLASAALRKEGEAPKPVPVPGPPHGEG